MRAAPNAKKVCHSLLLCCTHVADLASSVAAVQSMHAQLLARLGSMVSSEPIADEAALLVSIQIFENVSNYYVVRNG